MISRRTVLRWLGGLSAGAVSTAGYAIGIEPARLVETTYRLTPPGWPKGFNLKLAVLADIHACDPWMTPAHVRAIVARTNALAPDATLLLGDYVVAHKWISGRVPAHRWADELGALKAPLGVHAVLGNHDWWDDPIAQARGKGPTDSHIALRAAGIKVYENDAVRVQHAGQALWFAGLGDQYAVLRYGPRGRTSRGVDDLRGTLAQITDTAPVILMAHEPDIFGRVPSRVALTLSGHTHGGQIRLFGRAAYEPYGHEPYSYGHYREGTGPLERNLIVSGGLGCSVMPVRFGIPPEIVIVELGSQGQTA